MKINCTYKSVGLMMTRLGPSQKYVGLERGDIKIQVIKKCSTV